MDIDLNISQFDYILPSERIPRFPLERREESKLLVYNDGSIIDSHFYDIASHLPSGSLVVVNDTKVVRARLVFAKPTGARIEIFCLEPVEPADYERAFAAQGSCTWSCIVGNSKRWKDGSVSLIKEGIEIRAHRTDLDGVIRFDWNSSHTFGELLELVGSIPIPPYLERESQEIDNSRYQTTYSRIDGSVAAPTAGLHFTPSVLEQLPNRASVTLHVGAGTFLPVKCENVAEHAMHTEHFSIEIGELTKLASSVGNIIAVGTTTVRTLESLAVLGERVRRRGAAFEHIAVGQWEAYDGLNVQNPIPDIGSVVTKNIDGIFSKSSDGDIDGKFSNSSDDKLRETNPLADLYDYMVQNGIETLHGSTQIMITPGYRFRTIQGLVTNFHQPRSTLLLLISAIVGDSWHAIYDHALEHDYRFLSYGDSSLLMLNK